MLGGGQRSDDPTDQPRIVVVHRFRGAAVEGSSIDTVVGAPANAGTTVGSSTVHRAAGYFRTPSIARRVRSAPNPSL